MNAPAAFPCRPPSGWLYLARTLAVSRIYRLQASESAPAPMYRSECFPEDLADEPAATAHHPATAACAA
ncbi:MAG TPA: hypothetical protein PKJ32_07335 [Piscinibacter sp.]|nr:hypothetical protein [Piscinibacter sp.]